MWRFDDAAFFRDTQIPARFLLFDSKLTAVVFLVLVHFRIWTIATMVIVLAVFTWVEWRGMRVDNAVRRVRSLFAGRLRHARGPAMRRRVSDITWQASLPLSAFGLAEAAVEGAGNGEAQAVARRRWRWRPWRRPKGEAAA